MNARMFRIVIALAASILLAGGIAQAQTNVFSDTFNAGNESGPGYVRDLTTNSSARESGTILTGYAPTNSSTGGGMTYDASDFNSPYFEALLTGLTAYDYDYCLYVGNASYSSEQNSTYLDYYYIAPTANFVDPNTGNFYTGLTTISYNVDPEPGNSNTSAVLFGSNIAPDGTAAGGQNAYTRAQFGVNMTPDGNVLYVNNSGWTLATCEYGSSTAQWLSGAFSTTADQYINVKIGINYTGSATYLSVWLNGSEVLTNWLDVDVYGNPANFPGNYVYLGSQVGYSSAQPCTLYDNLSITNAPVPEPSSLVSLLSGCLLGGLTLIRRRVRR